VAWLGQASRLLVLRVQSARQNGERKEALASNALQARCVGLGSIKGSGVSVLMCMCLCGYVHVLIHVHELRFYAGMWYVIQAFVWICCCDVFCIYLCVSPCSASSCSTVCCLRVPVLYITTRACTRLRVSYGTYLP
jgi:hypothetical protein